MTDQSLRRADELLTELVDQVETARAVPMSASCVLPRERVLDLLDELREVLPVEIEDARRVLGSRDSLLHDAYTEATSVRETAGNEAEAMVANATTRAAEIVRHAEVVAYETVEQGKAEHASLVSATTVHSSATRAAAEVRASAEDLARQLQADAQAQHRQAVVEADRYATSVRGDAERYAARLAADSEDYADRTLYDLATTLQRAAATAEQGRVALAQRRAGHEPEPAADSGPFEAEQPAGAEAEIVYDLEAEQDTAVYEPAAAGDDVVGDVAGDDSSATLDLGAAERVPEPAG